MSRPPVRLTFRGYCLLYAVGSFAFLLVARTVAAVFVIGVG